MLAYLSCHCGRLPTPRHEPTAAIDAKARQYDPTETSGLRVRMRAEGRKRWQNFARTLRQGLVEHDIIGLRGIGRLPHGDKTEGFADWIAGELAHKVFAQGLWLKPYIRKAAEIAQEQAQGRVSNAAAVDPLRVRAIESLAIAELKGIVETAMQQLTRVATHRMMANHSPHKIANALAAVVRSMSRRTDALVGDVVARAHATATLSAYKSAGVTHVGIIPEHVPPPLHGLRFRARDGVAIVDMTQIEIANLVGEEEARKIRQWRSGTRKASSEELAEWRGLGIVGVTEGEVEAVGEIRAPLPTLIEKARKHWRAQFIKLAKRHGTKGALQRVETQLAAEGERLAKAGAEFRKGLRAGTKEFVAKAKARGEAQRALQAIVREDLFQQAAELSGYRQAPQRRAGPGSRVSREETPSAATIGRIEKAQARLAAILGGGLVDVITAGDDDVCFTCESIAEEGPYSLDEAQGLIPQHPNCRCAFAPAGKYEKDAVSREAAGVMFRIPSGHMLLMKRQDTGEWAIPAGMLDENEPPLHGAQREAAEETGYPGDVGAEKIDERVRNGLRFHTFLQPVAVKFEPILNSEHTDWGWFHLDDIPWPLHPGLAATLRKIDVEKPPFLK